MRGSVAPLADLQAKLKQFQRDFDVDEAVGAQLDAIGKWVGIGRSIDIPISDYFFTWGGTDQVGWEAGVWEGYGDSRTKKYDLTDDMYRQLIKAKALLNSWKGNKGTTEEAYAVFNEALSQRDKVLIVDGELYQALFVLIFTWEDPERGWDVAEWAEEAPYPFFSWDTENKGWDEAVRGNPNFDIEEEGSVMTVYVLVQKNTFSEIEERMILSGTLPFKPAGVKVIYMTF